MSARSEAEMLGMLERRYRGETSGNGPAWAFVPHVRNAAGFDATRTVDAIAMSLWPSRGLELHGFEIKCSRSDWLRELKKPAKAETFFALCDRWWIVADDAIVHDGELPPGWGLLVPRGSKIVQKTAAAFLPPTGEAPFTKAGRSFLAALLRSAARTHDVTPQEVQQGIDFALEQHFESEARKRANLEETITVLRGRLDAFKSTFGVALGDADDPHWYGGKPAAEVGAALRLIVDGNAETERFENRLRTMLRDSERIVAELQRALGIAA